METKKKINILPICIILAIIIFASVVGLNIYRLKKNQPTTENIEDKVSYKNYLKLDDIITLVKDYYIDKDLVDLSNLESWNIPKATYIGYDKEKATGYYHLEGTYLCKSNAKKCVYVSQEVIDKGKYLFDVYVEVSDKDGKRTILNITQLSPNEENISKSEEELKNDLNKVNNISTLLKKYYEENNLVNKDNLTSWNFDYVEYYYKRNNNFIYEVQSTYICKDNSSDCVYVSQINDANQDKSYTIKLYVEVDSSQSKIISIDTVPYKESSSEENVPKPTEDNAAKRELIVNSVKKNYEDNSFVQKDNLASWNINKITYVGYYNSNSNEKIYKLEGNYKCSDSTSECIYGEQIGQKNADNSYPFLIYATFVDANNTLTFKNVFGALTTTENFTEVNEILD